VTKRSTFLSVRHLLLVRHRFIVLSSEDSDRALILETLEQAGWIVGGPRRRSGEARIEGTTLLAKMRRLGISRPIPQERTSVPASVSGCISNAP
jgi:hypothetical protein